MNEAYIVGSCIFVALLFFGTAWSELREWKRRTAPQPVRVRTHSPLPMSSRRARHEAMKARVVFTDDPKDDTRD